MIIYMTTNCINGKKYIGQDSADNPHYFGSGTIMKNAIRKYGKINFKKEILEVVSSKGLLDERERHYIKKFDAVNDKNFYNISEGGGGCSGYKHTEKHIRHIKSIKRSKSWRTAISKSLTGIKHSADRTHKNSKSQIGLQAGSKNPRARRFLITAPDGNSHIIHGKLKEFCAINALSFGCMLKVARGGQSHHKHWLVKYLDGVGPYNKPLI